MYPHIFPYLLYSLPIKQKNFAILAWFAVEDSFLIFKT